MENTNTSKTAAYLSSQSPNARESQKTKEKLQIWYTSCVQFEKKSQGVSKSFQRQKFPSLTCSCSICFDVFLNLVFEPCCSLGKKKGDQQPRLKMSKNLFHPHEAQQVKPECKNPQDWNNPFLFMSLHPTRTEFNNTSSLSWLAVSFCICLSSQLFTGHSDLQRFPYQIR